MLKKILLALQYAPYVSAAVHQVEDTHQALPGATKKQIVMAAIQAVSKTGESVPESHVQTVSTLIDLFVTMFNETHIFGTATKAPAAPAAVLTAAAAK